MDKRDIRDKVQEGYIHCSAILEMVGKPEKHVRDTLNKYLDKIEQSKTLILLEKELSEPKQLKDSEMFSMFAEVELLVKGTSNVIWFCFDYMPSSIEIIEPDQLNYSATDFTDFVNDLQSRLHDLDMTVKTVKATNDKLNKNTENLLKNGIKLAITNGHDTVDKVSKVMGVPKENMERIINTLVTAKVIKKEGENLKIPQ